MEQIKRYLRSNNPHMKSVKTLFLIFLAGLLSNQVAAQQVPQGWSEKLARTVMTIWKDSLIMEPGKPVKWAYDQGVVLEGITNMWKRTGKGEYFNYVQKSMDFFVDKDGNIPRYKQKDYNIDHLKNGRSLLLLYKVTKAEKYFKAASLLREQIKTHPRTNEGGFWHKKIYPYQMWLDGLYMGQPFYAEYAATYHQPEAFDDIANQFIYMENHARDAKTGLLYHGWDESKQQKWADPKTGLSPHFWGRAMGWYGMGLVDVLEYFPDNHPKRAALLAIMERYAKAVLSVQDPASGVWYQILDQPKGKGNYKESSASAMFVYSLAKAVRLGYLPASYEAAARKGYKGLIKEFMETDANGQVNLKGTVSVAGLGGKPYRDGSYEYYLSEKVVSNDPKGVGAFLLASNEMEIRNTPQLGKNKLILLDSYFNNEFKNDATGKSMPWHYKWNELENGGFYLLGENARYTGARTAELKAAPTAENLKSAAVYIIVDPDTDQETASPNYVSKKDIQAISTWVKNGGVLLLMANDEGNAELDHFNELAKTFGITFKKESKNKVTGKQFDMGRIDIPKGNTVFPKPYSLYLKEISTLSLKSPAQSILKHKGDNIMAISRYGKGTVFAVGDPWLYNEYTDGRKLPAIYQNFEAGNDLIKWLLKQSNTPPLTSALSSKVKSDLTVARDGSGQFRSIQEALNSLPDTAPSQRRIFIKKGFYEEKIFLTKHQVKLEGEDPESTIISFPIARDLWRLEHADDWGAAVLNLSGDDITLKGLSVINSFGFDNPEDSLAKKSHQFALRSFQSTRLQAVNCMFRSYAGDTVSPWNDTTGLYYFRDCLMEGGVDLYCPRGWAYAENIRFFCRSTSAAIWHDGSKNKDAKSVIKNSTFEGLPGYKLGRYHRDAQIYMLGNVFSADMADAAIYRAASSTGVSWGHRIYYSGNKSKGGNYSWLADNLNQAPAAPKPDQLTIDWTFDGKWYPSEAKKRTL